MDKYQANKLSPTTTIIKINEASEIGNIQSGIAINSNRNPPGICEFVYTTSGHNISHSFVV